MQGRLKSVASIHRKMTRKQCPLSEVYDTLALRVLVDDEQGLKEEEAIEVSPPPPPPPSLACPSPLLAARIFQ